MDPSNVEAEEREQSQRSNGAAFLTGEVEGTGIKRHVASVAGHSSSEPSEAAQERITEMLDHRGIPEMLLSILIHFKHNLSFKVYYNKKATQ